MNELLVDMKDGSISIIKQNGVILQLNVNERESVDETG
jgi:hypothetical protein